MVSSLHRHRSKENHHVGSFPSFFRCPFGYPLDPDSITGLKEKSVVVDSEVCWVSWMNSLCGGLRAWGDLRKEWLERSVNDWSLNWGSFRGSLPNITS